MKIYEKKKVLFDINNDIKHVQKFKTGTPEMNQIVK